MQFGSPGNRNNPWLLGQQPGKRNLRACCVLTFSNKTQSLNNPLIRFEILFVEARNDLAEVRVAEISVFFNGPSQESLAQRTEWHKADPEFLQRRKNLLLRLPPPQRILTLESRDRLNRMGTTNVCCSGLRHTEMLDLTFLNEIPDGARHVFNRHIRVDAMLVEQVDHVAPEPLQCGFSDRSDPFGFAVGPLRWHAVLETELRRDDNSVSYGFERFAHDLFVEVRPVGLRGVEKRNSAFKGRPDHRNCLLFLRGRPVAKAESHATESES